MNGLYRRELEVIIGAVQVAARISQHIIGDQDKDVIQKLDFSPVTVADFAIQALLGATVKESFPGDDVVGEEDSEQLQGDLLLLERVYELLLWAAGEDGAELPKGVAIPRSRQDLCAVIDQCAATAPGNERRTWVFDPVDGTKTYVRGELYAINAALLVNGQQTVGVVCCPNMSMDAAAPLCNSDIDSSGCILFAVKGCGAYVRPLGGSEPTKLPFHEPGQEPRLVTSATMATSTLPDIHAIVAQRLLTPYPGSDLLPWVLRWAVLALGLGNTTFWVYKSKERRGKVWDHAGAMLLFEETGGVITDIHGKRIDLTAGRKMLGNFGFVAAPGDLHGRVLASVREVLKEKGHDNLLENTR